MHWGSENGDRCGISVDLQVETFACFDIFRASAVSKTAFTREWGLYGRCRVSRQWELTPEVWVADVVL
jgi:hypothetical protein